MAKAKVDARRSQLRPQDVNILLVDDKPERLLSYEVVLGSLGYSLVRALSGTEALGLLMKMEFAAILLDVSMPDMDGFETAALIRGHPRFEETPIIFVTGVQVTDIDQLRGYEIGAVDYVQIPVVPSILRGKVQALVQLYLHRAELRQLNHELAAANAELAAAHEALKAENTRELTLLNQHLERTNCELTAANTQLLAEISEREKVEHALSLASQRKDEYIATLAHELRNPLSAIHNAVQVLQLSDVSDQQLAWAKNLLSRQVNHLTCLMDDLLDVSRITSGRIQLRLEPVDLNATIRHTLDTLAPLFAKHQHRVELRLPAQALYVRGDMVRLTQILDNLLTNATKYMDDGGLIELSLTLDANQQAVICVRDHGVGISEELLDKVFELFVQAPSATNRAEGGLGIGLALVRALAELHGGSVMVASEGHNCGASFSVRLPVLEALPQVSDPCDTQQRAAHVMSGAKSVLIIDDNVDSAEGLQVYLSEQGFRVDACYSGEDGLVAAADGEPDIILLDIGLPGMNGYEVTRRLRRMKQTVPLTIIAMSGYSGDTDKKQAQLAGFDHYLVKPVDFSELQQLIAASGRAATRPVAADQYS